MWRLRTIGGASTGVSQPVGVIVDLVNDQLVVANLTSAVLTFPRAADGNVSPVRLLTGPSTGLNGPTGIATLQPVTLAVVKDGSGDGTVTSLPAGIDCGTDCAAVYAAGAVVTLTPTPAPGSLFDGWAGDCDGSEDCTVTVDRSPSVTATFSSAQLLTVTVAGSGSLTSDPPGVACPGDCSESYATGTNVTLDGHAGRGMGLRGLRRRSGLCRRHGHDERAGTLAATFRLPATIALGNLAQVYDGTPRAVTASTTPPGLGVAITYSGSPARRSTPAATRSWRPSPSRATRQARPPRPWSSARQARA